MAAHNDNEPSDIPFRPRPSLRRAWRRAAPLTLAAAAHVALAAGWIAAGRLFAPPTRPDAPQPIVVTLVERPTPPAVPQEPSSAEPDAGPPDSPSTTDETAPPVDFAVRIEPSSRALLLLPETLTSPDGAEVVGPLPDSVRLALASALACRSAAAPADLGQPGSETCAPASERFADADFARIEPTAFLDPAFAPPREPGTAEFTLGPVVVSLSMFGPGATPYQLTIKPRPQGDKTFFGPTPDEAVFQAV